jgi:hypothetical protein
MLRPSKHVPKFLSSLLDMTERVSYIVSSKLKLEGEGR